ncbi:DUF3048 domain-containing protein [Paenibacillus lemnae]|uniref:DUF3048 domain-containing protein n=2 Tax=Paenibacillus lemnae TaxID=1330551 RepID=A0A848M8A2_PAELE|nr:DUF3048 domain-containing protein [Paenibacillus lemnae]NMO97438.1 DUF3048 domain-containing protein [Paenibacillus lemnae]
MNRKKAALRSALLSLAAAMLLSACSGDKAAEAPAVTEPVPAPPPAVEEPVEAPPEEEKEVTAAEAAPLTGLAVEEASKRRPLAVMINNAPAARPQSGLSKADIVYEVLAEGGITRLIAIYQSQTGIETIGPVRSIRPYLINIGESFGGVLVHAGGSPEAYSIIKNQSKQDLDEIGSAGSYFWRSRDRKAPHNLYTSEENLRQAVAKHNYPQEIDIPAFTFVEDNKADRDAELIDIDIEPATRVDIHFLLKSYSVGYTYDDSSQTYKRSINNQPHIDLNDRSVLEAANVVVLGADHRVLDDVGRLSIDLQRGGEAMLFQRGQVIRGEWIHKSGDVIRFVKDGKEVPFYPGTTYFNVVPNSPPFESHITISNP